MLVRNTRNGCDAVYILKMLPRRNNFWNIVFKLGRMKYAVEYPQTHFFIEKLIYLLNFLFFCSCTYHWEHAHLLFVDLQLRASKYIFLNPISALSESINMTSWYLLFPLLRKLHLSANHNLCPERIFGLLKITIILNKSVGSASKFIVELFRIDFWRYNKLRYS